MSSFSPLLRGDAEENMFEASFTANRTQESSSAETIVYSGEGVDYS